MQSSALFLALLTVAVTCAQAQTQTTTSLAAVPPSLTFGQAVKLTASVSPSAAFGKITFYDGMSIVGVASLSNGAASFSTVSIGYGKRLLTTRYGGDSYADSLFVPVAVNVATKPGGTFVPGAAPKTDLFNEQPAALADLNHDEHLDLIAIGKQRK